jgi:hypothetical protein
MAVTALPRTRTRAPRLAATLPPLVLVLTLIAPAVDLLAIVQPGVLAPSFGVVATGVAAAVLALTWARYPRTSWVAAASLAACAGLALRVVGAEVAPVLSLLAVVALGIGGAFASPQRSAEAWLGQA